MSGSFKIFFDTTPPSLEIVAPQYTIKDISTTITITSNESLLNWQDIYIVDSMGIRHDLIFLYEDNQFTADILFNDLSYGIATFYCRLKDTVDNMSDLISKTINIWNGAMITVSLDTFEGNVNIEIFESVPSLEFYEMSCNVVENELKPILAVAERNIKIEVNEVTS